MLKLADTSLLLGESDICWKFKMLQISGWVVVLQRIVKVKAYTCISNELPSSLIIAHPLRKAEVGHLPLGYPILTFSCPPPKVKGDI